MYAAEIDGKTYTFQVSGSLWQDALVMMDMETKSLWSQVSGECIQGNMIGKKLDLVPVSHTTYEEFKSSHPGGKLLKKEARGDHGSRYESYFADGEKLGMFGRADNVGRLPGKVDVFGLRFEDKQVAVSLAWLEQFGFALIKSVSPPVVVTYDTSSKTVAAFRLPPKLMNFLDKLVVTGEKIGMEHSLVAYHPQTGRAIAGGGDNLEAVPVITAFWFAWATFFPETELIH